MVDTNPFPHAGYELASRFLRIDQALIESPARELTSQGTMEGDALKKCLDANACPINLDELETRRGVMDQLDQSGDLERATRAHNTSRQ